MLQLRGGGAGVKDTPRGPMHTENLGARGVAAVRDYCCLDLSVGTLFCVPMGYAKHMAYPDLECHMHEVSLLLVIHRRWSCSGSVYSSHMTVYMPCLGILSARALFE